MKLISLNIERLKRTATIDTKTKGGNTKSTAKRARKILFILPYQSYSSRSRRWESAGW